MYDSQEVKTLEMNNLEEVVDKLNRFLKRLDKIKDKLSQL